MGLSVFHATQRVLLDLARVLAIHVFLILALLHHSENATQELIF